MNHVPIPVTGKGNVNGLAVALFELIQTQAPQLMGAARELLRDFHVAMIPHEWKTEEILARDA